MNKAFDVLYRAAISTTLVRWAPDTRPGATKGDGWWIYGEGDNEQRVAHNSPQTIALARRVWGELPKVFGSGPYDGGFW